MSTKTAWIEEEIAALKEQGLFTHIRTIESHINRNVTYDLNTQVVKDPDRIIQNTDLFREIGCDIHGHIGDCDELVVCFHLKIGKMGEQVPGPEAVFLVQHTAEHF